MLVLAVIPVPYLFLTPIKYTNKDAIQNARYARTKS